VSLEVTEASISAIEAVERLGGSVVTVYNSKLSLRALLKPHKFAVLPKTPVPPPKSMPYYTSDEKRGYLSRLVQLRKVESSQ
jgi:large subunit ribosomal protein L15